MVKFFRGLASKYNSTTHKDGLYFATDKGQLFVNGIEYGSAGLVKDVTLENNVLTVSYKDTEEVKTFNLISLLAKASAETDGLMASADKVLLDAIRKGLEEEGATLFTAADQERLTVAEGDIDSLEERMGVAEKAIEDEAARAAEREDEIEDALEAYVASNNAALAGEVARATEAEGGLADEIDVERQRINVLVGSVEGDDARSAREIVQDEVAKQLTSENISESFDTLKEMAEWLSSHPADVKEMSDAIAANTEAIGDNAEAIAALQEAVGEGGSVADKIADALAEAKEYADDAVAVHVEATNTAIADLTKALNDHKTESSTAFADFKAGYVDTTAVAGINLTNTDGKVGVNVVAADLGAVLVGTADAQGPVKGSTVYVGQEITGVTAIAATSTVAAAIQTVATDVKAITDSTITSITGDDYITVTGEGNDRALAFEVQKVGAYLVDNTQSALQVDESGKLAIKWVDVE